LSFRYDDIANRLRAFRLGSGLSADEIARRTGVSRTALYRLEKGELVKIETLERLAELLEVSIPTLLGVGIEYISSAVSYFERVRQIEESAEHVSVIANPISFLLASDKFEQTLEKTLSESVPAGADRARALSDIARIMSILQKRKDRYRQRQPSIVNLMSGLEISRFVRDGMVGSYDLPEDVQRERRALARAEVAHFANLIEAAEMGVQIGIIPENLPQSGIAIFRQPDRQILVTSPFRLGEHPNVRIGVAMITSAPEALALHRKVISELWKRSLKGSDAVSFLRGLLDTAEPEPVGDREPVARRRSVVGRSPKTSASSRARG
jgi:transcriptional regulator with XRE-family HTH domain